MQADLVFVAQGNRNSALGVLRGRFGQLQLGKHQHLAGLGQIDGRPQSGYTGAHDNEIHPVRKFFHEVRMVTKFLRFRAARIPCGRYGNFW